ncbi:hypothetical protein Q5P01_020508 [Channa striata]|uniref:Uncharacterized protein n=1 Tax=Channa striata TaxID=64152 RepID=A0AA88LXP0_CHASR|nr:hypothetical protein Q5P01_020508 [Channa striata]
MFFSVCALLRVACQKTTPHNVAESSKSSKNPNPPWLTMLLLRLPRFHSSSGPEQDLSTSPIERCSTVGTGLCWVYRNAERSL